jgi:aryl-alcohol dehydrogenase-like predicted oxidoreductase
MNEKLVEEHITLGKTDVRIPPLGTGAWSWGDRLFWGFGGTYDESDVHGAFEASLETGINFFDTAEMYGFGNSERLLGKFSRSLEQPLVIATKFLPLPLRSGKSRLLAALNGSLRRLEMKQVDLYQIHWPVPLVSIETLMEGMAQAVDQGLTRSVGVSNYNATQMQKAQSILSRYDIPLASNQVIFSLLDRDVERNGLLDLCRREQITLIAYSPLKQGILTGKYTPENLPSGVRSRRYSKGYIEKVQPLIRLMREIGEGRGGKTPAQIAINWTICKGAVPIPGAKNARQARDNAGALGWRLSQEEMTALDRASDAVTG